MTASRDSRTASPPWLARHRGQLLDALVLLANLLLQAPFALLLQPGPDVATTDDAAARWLGAIVLAALLAYTLGAVLKRAPLHARVPALPDPAHAGCLFVGWVGLHLVLSILGAAAVVVGFAAAPKALLVVAMIVLCTLPTLFAARVVLRPGNLGNIPAWRQAAAMEWAADLLIAVAVVLATLTWNVWGAELFATWTGPTFPDKLIAAALAAASFAMLYVTPRFLFLIEDHDRWTTWATIALTPAPLLGRMLIG
jgi:hypothetical protein